MKKTVIILLAIQLLLASACGMPASQNAMESDSETALSALDSATEVNAPPVDAAIRIMGEAMYVYDVYVPEYKAYYCDQIFTAKILDVGERFDPNWEPACIEQYGEPTEHDPCYTRFTLEVTGVIKGDLQTGDVIDGQKKGYFDEETQEYYMVTDDIFPEEGKEYLILSSNRMNPDIYSFSGPNSVFPLEPSEWEISTYALTEEEPDRQEIIDKYTEAFQNAAPDPDAPSFVEGTGPNGPVPVSESGPEDIAESSFDEPISSTYE